MPQNKRIYIGVVPAALLKLLDQKAHAFSPNELMVIEALKRSDASLINADKTTLSQYLAGYSPDQLQGIANNVKGIYHEIRYATAENLDGDEIEASLYELTNHPGADVRLTNTVTGEISDIQLKATNSAAYIADHYENYPGIDLLSTEEVSEPGKGILSSGLRNEELTEDVSNSINALVGNDNYIVEAAAASGLISAALNTRGVLQGKQTNATATRKTLEDLGIACSSAAVIELLVG